MADVDMRDLGEILRDLGNTDVEMADSEPDAVCPDMDELSTMLASTTIKDFGGIPTVGWIPGTSKFGKGKDELALMQRPLTEENIAGYSALLNSRGDNCATLSDFFLRPPSFVKPLTAEVQYRSEVVPFERQAEDVTSKYTWVNYATRKKAGGAFNFLFNIATNLEIGNAILFVFGINHGAHMVVLRGEGTPSRRVLALYDPQRGTLSPSRFVPRVPGVTVKPYYHKVSEIERPGGGTYSNFSSLIWEICFMSLMFRYVPGANTVEDVMKAYFSSTSTGFFRVPIEKIGRGRKHTFRRKQKLNKYVRRVQSKKGTRKQRK